MSQEQENILKIVNDIAKKRYSGYDLTENFQKAIEWLTCPENNYLLEKYSYSLEDKTYIFVFDYPEYCDLETKVKNKLFSDEVDAIQDIFSYEFLKSYFDNIKLTENNIINKDKKYSKKML